MTDLAAARERHKDCTPGECVCLPQRLYGDDCDVAIFRDALDEDIIANGTLAAIRALELEAARALADELAAALLEHKVSGCEWYDEWPDETNAALAKWEASRG